MGGTGVIRFCGEDFLQLIISKRHPKLSLNGNNWGFTIIKRHDPLAGAKNSTTKYLAPGGKISEFNLSQIHIPFHREGTQNISPLEFGTIIKLYDYRMPGGLKTSIILDLNYKISLLLPRVGLPIRFYEQRGYTAHSAETTMAGLKVRLDEDSRENIELSFRNPPASHFYINNQKFNYVIYVFKDGKSKNYRNNEGLIFTYNGQAHGFLPISFFERKSVKLGYLSKSILVMIDCSEIDQRTRELLFMTNRNGLTDGDLRKEIEDELEEILRSHQGLKELNYKRRAKLVQNKLEDSRPLQEVLSDIIKKSPSLKALFNQGGDFSNPFDFSKATEVESDFVGAPYPSYFNLMQGEANKDCHLKQRFRVQFKTDVCDDYFHREENCGEFKLKINSNPYKAYTLNPWKGIHTLNVSLPEGTIVGDVLNCEVIVNGDLQLSPFKIEFIRNVKGVQKKIKSKPGKRRNLPKDGNGDREIPQGLALPQVTEIYKDEWEAHDFDEKSALRVIDSGEAGFDYFINMDNKYIFHEIKKRGLETDSSLVKAKYKYAMVLIGMAILNDRSIFENDSRKEEQDIEEKVDIKDIIRYVTRAFAPITIPMIDTLGELNLDDIVER